MKFASVLALAAAATVVSAETNADRLARGLPPMAPARRATPVAAAKRTSPSGGGQCNTWLYPVILDELLALLGIHIPINTSCGMSCFPHQHYREWPSVPVATNNPVCCENNSYNGLVNIGCSPINI
ncbi:hydrophobin [Suillus lakei]|nr:hydrophobin [Suillus lakei]